MYNFYVARRDESLWFYTQYYDIKNRSYTCIDALEGCLRSFAISAIEPHLQRASAVFFFIYSVIQVAGRALVFTTTNIARERTC